MSALPDRPDRLTLAEAIEQQINLGEKDPVTAVQKLANLYGGDWIAEELAANWEEILTEIARQKMGDARRSSIMSISDYAREGKPKKRDVVLASLFVPRKGYISLGDATVDDLAAAAEYRRHLASGLVRWADWFDAVAAKLQAQQVVRVRDLRGQLPELPRPELES